MNKNVFEIRNLKCSYQNYVEQQNNEEDVVLEVNHLDIRRNEITIFLGPSGSGKSTLLETLGLMNETIRGGEVLFYPKKDSESPIRLNEIKEARDNTKNEIRKEYYSFIFQSTNLMSNFTAIENIAVTSLIQKGNNLAGSLANSIKNIVNLNVRSCTWEKYPAELSGGERLRVSVARAITPNHSVLFGDEPTGNLDHFNSDQVLEFIKEKVEAEDNLSVIIVSHSIELAMKFANQIVILTPDSKNLKKYNILQEDIIQKGDKFKWNKEFIEERIKPHYNGAITYDKLLKDLKDKKLKEEILEKLGQKCEPQDHDKKNRRSWFLTLFHATCMLINKLWKQNELTKFIKLFFNNEGKELLGRKYLNFIFVSIIIAITYFAIGFSNGSLDYLSKKMDDPFVRAVNVRLPGSSKEYSRVLRVVNEWMQDSVKRFYYIEDHYGYNVFSYYVKGDKPNSPKMELKIRTIKYDDPLVKTILDKKINNSIGYVFQDSLKTSMIVTKEALERIESSVTPAFLYYTRNSGDQAIDIPLEVQGIVDKLPGNEGVSIDVMVPRSFYDKYFGNSELLNKKFLYSDKKLHVLAEVDSTKINDLKVVLENWPSSPLMIDTILIAKYDHSLKSIYKLEFEFEGRYDQIEYGDIDSVYKQLSSSIEITRLRNNQTLFDLLQSYNLNLSAKKSQKYDFYTFYFNDLARINSFAEEFKIKTGLELEMSKIEQMQNYNFISKLTQLISFILIVFAVAMINVYLGYILYNHLNNIKLNIGTLKAFGIDNRRIYNIMMFSFVFLSWLIGFVCAGVFGYLGLMKGVLYIVSLVFNVTVEKGIKYFDLNNWYTVIATLILFVVSYFVYSNVVKFFFKQTPGNLIYDRSNKA